MSDVARAGSQALDESLVQEKVVVERWLSVKVVATYDAMKARPERAISGQDVAERMCARHHARLARDM